MIPPVYLSVSGQGTAGGAASVASPALSHVEPWFAQDDSPMFQYGCGLPLIAANSVKCGQSGFLCDECRPVKKTPLCCYSMVTMVDGEVFQCGSNGYLCAQCESNNF